MYGSIIIVVGTIKDINIISMNKKIGIDIYNIINNK